MDTNNQASAAEATGPVVQSNHENGTAAAEQPQGAPVQPEGSSYGQKALPPKESSSGRAARQRDKSVPARFRDGLQEGEEEEAVLAAAEPTLGAPAVGKKRKRPDGEGGAGAAEGEKKPRPPKKRQPEPVEPVHAPSEVLVVSTEPGEAPLVKLIPRGHPSSSSSSSSSSAVTVAISQASRAQHVLWPNPPQNDVGEDDEHLHYCTVCESNEPTLVLCDGCPRIFHLSCVGLSKTAVRYYNWYCPVCASMGLTYERKQQKVQGGVSASAGKIEGSSGGQDTTEDAAAALAAPGRAGEAGGAGGKQRMQAAGRGKDKARKSGAAAGSAPLAITGSADGAVGDISTTSAADAALPAVAEPAAKKRKHHELDQEEEGKEETLEPIDALARSCVEAVIAPSSLDSHFIGIPVPSSSSSSSSFWSCVDELKGTDVLLEKQRVVSITLQPGPTLLPRPFPANAAEAEGAAVVAAEAGEDEAEFFTHFVSKLLTNDRKRIMGPATTAMPVASKKGAGGGASTDHTAAESELFVAPPDSRPLSLSLTERLLLYPSTNNASTVSKIVPEKLWRTKAKVIVGVSATSFAAAAGTAKSVAVPATAANVEAAEKLAAEVAASAVASSSAAAAAAAAAAGAAVAAAAVVGSASAASATGAPMPPVFESFADFLKPSAPAPAAAAEAISGGAAPAIPPLVPPALLLPATVAHAAAEEAPDAKGAEGNEEEKKSGAPPSKRRRTMGASDAGAAAAATAPLSAAPAASAASALVFDPEGLAGAAGSHTATTAKEAKALSSLIRQLPAVSDDGNEALCGVCGSGGDMVCCDSCTASYHVECEQQLRVFGLPEGDVRCSLCSARMRTAVALSDLLRKLPSRMDKDVEATATKLVREVKEQQQQLASASSFASSNHPAGTATPTSSASAVHPPPPHPQPPSASPEMAAIMMGLGLPSIQGLLAPSSSSSSSSSFSSSSGAAVDKAFLKGSASKWLEKLASSVSPSVSALAMFRILWSMLNAHDEYGNRIAGPFLYLPGRNQVPAAFLAPDVAMCVMPEKVAETLGPLLDGNNRKAGNGSDDSFDPDEFSKLLAWQSANQKKSNKAAALAHHAMLVDDGSGPYVDASAAALLHLLPLLLHVSPFVDEDDLKQEERELEKTTAPLPASAASVASTAVPTAPPSSSSSDALVPAQQQPQRAFRAPVVLSPVPFPSHPALSACGSLQQLRFRRQALLYFPAKPLDLHGPGPYRPIALVPLLDKLACGAYNTPPASDFLLDRYSYFSLNARSRGTTAAEKEQDGDGEKEGADSGRGRKATGRTGKGSKGRAVSKGGKGARAGKSRKSEGGAAAPATAESEQARAEGADGGGEKMDEDKPAEEGSEPASGNSTARSKTATAATTTAASLAKKTALAPPPPPLAPPGHWDVPSLMMTIAIASSSALLASKEHVAALWCVEGGFELFCERARSALHKLIEQSAFPALSPLGFCALPEGLLRFIFDLATVAANTVVLYPPTGVQYRCAVLMMDILVKSAAEALKESCKILLAQCVPALTKALIEAHEQRKRQGQQQTQQQGGVAATSASASPNEPPPAELLSAVEQAVKNACDETIASVEACVKASLSTLSQEFRMARALGATFRVHRAELLKASAERLAVPTAAAAVAPSSSSFLAPTAALTTATTVSASPSAAAVVAANAALVQQPAVAPSLAQNIEQLQQKKEGPKKPRKSLGAAPLSAGKQAQHSSGAIDAEKKKVAIRLRAKSTSELSSSKERTLMKQAAEAMRSRQKVGEGAEDSGIESSDYEDEPELKALLQGLGVTIGKRKSRRKATEATAAAETAAVSESRAVVPLLPFPKDKVRLGVRLAIGGLLYAPAPPHPFAPFMVRAKGEAAREERGGNQGASTSIPSLEAEAEASSDADAEVKAAVRFLVEGLVARSCARTFFPPYASFAPDEEEERQEANRGYAAVGKLMQPEQGAAAAGSVRLTPPLLQALVRPRLKLKLVYPQGLPDKYDESDAGNDASGSRSASETESETDDNEKRLERAKEAMGGAAAREEAKRLQAEEQRKKEGASAAASAATAASVGAGVAPANTPSAASSSSLTPMGAAAVAEAKVRLKLVIGKKKTVEGEGPASSLSSSSSSSSSASSSFAPSADAAAALPPPSSDDDEQHEGKQEKGSSRYTLAELAAMSNEDAARLLTKEEREQRAKERKKISNRARRKFLAEQKLINKQNEATVPATAATEQPPPQPQPRPGGDKSDGAASSADSVPARLSSSSSSSSSAAPSDGATDAATATTTAVADPKSGPSSLAALTAAGRSSLRGRHIVAPRKFTDYCDPADLGAGGVAPPESDGDKDSDRADGGGTDGEGPAAAAADGSAADYKRQLKKKDKSGAAMGMDVDDNDKDGANESGTEEEPLALPDGFASVTDEAAIMTKDAARSRVALHPNDYCWLLASLFRDQGLSLDVSRLMAFRMRVFLRAVISKKRAAGKKIAASSSSSSSSSSASAAGVASDISVAITEALFPGVASSALGQQSVTGLALSAITRDSSGTTRIIPVAALRPAGGTNKQDTGPEKGEMIAINSVVSLPALPESSASASASSSSAPGASPPTGAVSNAASLVETATYGPLSTARTPAAVESLLALQKAEQLRFLCHQYGESLEGLKQDATPPPMPAALLAANHANKSGGGGAAATSSSSSRQDPKGRVAHHHQHQHQHQRQGQGQGAARSQPQPQNKDKEEHVEQQPATVAIASQIVESLKSSLASQIETLSAEVNSSGNTYSLPALPRALSAAMAFADTTATGERPALPAPSSSSSSSSSPSAMVEMDGAKETPSSSSVYSFPHDVVGFFRGDPVKCEGCRYGWEHICAFADSICWVRVDGTVVPVTAQVEEGEKDGTKAELKGAVTSASIAQLKAIICGALLYHGEVLLQDPSLANELPESMRTLPAILGSTTAGDEQGQDKDEESTAAVASANTLAKQRILDTVASLTVEQMRSLALRLLVSVDHAIIRDDMALVSAAAAGGSSSSSISSSQHQQQQNLKSLAMRRYLQLSVLPPTLALSELNGSCGNNKKGSTRNEADELLSLLYTDSLMATSLLVDVAASKGSRLLARLRQAGLLPEADALTNQLKGSSGSSKRQVGDEEAEESDLLVDLEASSSSSSSSSRSSAAHKGPLAGLKSALLPGSEDAVFSYLALRRAAAAAAATITDASSADTKSKAEALLYGAVKRWMSLMANDNGTSQQQEQQDQVAEAQPQLFTSARSLAYSKDKARATSASASASAPASASVTVPSAFAEAVGVAEAATSTSSAGASDGSSSTTNSSKKSHKLHPTTLLRQERPIVSLAPEMTLRFVQKPTPTSRWVSMQEHTERARYNTSKLQLGRSRIEGTGLFATEDIEMDDCVCEYTGEVIDESTCDAREAFYESHGIADYMFRLSDNAIVDATMKGCRARYINHSCDPNCFAVITVPAAGGAAASSSSSSSQQTSSSSTSSSSSGGGGSGSGGGASSSGPSGASGSNGSSTTATDGWRVFIYASRRISKGEELSYDYSFPADEKLVVCKCGAAACRGSLNIRK